MAISLETFYLVEAVIAAVSLLFLLIYYIIRHMQIKSLEPGKKTFSRKKQKMKMNEKKVPGNILGNLYWIFKSRPISGLKNAFSGKPGFIISPGPSLEKDIRHLEKINDRGILIAAENTLKPLLKHSIQPHFATFGDPFYNNYLHLRGVEEELRFFIVAEAGITGQVFKDFQDKIFTFSIGSPFEKILEAHSEPLGEIKGRGSVISIALEFGVYIGLNPIILIGEDFDLVDTRNHRRCTSREEKQIESPEYLGLYKNYPGQLLNEHPDIRLIKTTRGGIFPGIPYIHLSKVIKTFINAKEPIDFSFINQLPTLNNRQNIDRMLTFLSQTKESFQGYLGKINEALELIEENKQFSSHIAPGVLRQLEQIQQYLYSTPQYREILEIWSFASLNHFLRDYDHTRDQPLNGPTTRNSFEIYADYFLNIHPVVKDIIIRFKRSIGRLVGLVSSSVYGSWLIRLREGGNYAYIPHNPYMFEAVKLRGLLYTLPELEGEFPNIFDNPAQPLVLEVGCYKGHTVIELAEHNPGINVLGLDIKYKRVVKSSRKIQEARLTNAKIAFCDVMDLLSILPEHSVYGLFIFFPDPWIKRRHEKYRYLNKDFFTMVSSRLGEGGFIWIKTDQKNYFDEITTAAKQYNFSESDCLPGSIAQREYRTVFEEIFIKKKVSYYHMILSL